MATEFRGRWFTGLMQSCCINMMRFTAYAGILAMLVGFYGVCPRRFYLEISCASLPMLGCRGASLLAESRTKRKCWFDFLDKSISNMPSKSAVEFLGCLGCNPL